MTFWGICLRAELEAHPAVWRIAKDFESEQSALSAMSVATRVERTVSRQDFRGAELSPWRGYRIGGNGKEPGMVYRFEPGGGAPSAVAPSLARKARPAMPAMPAKKAEPARKMEPARKTKTKKTKATKTKKAAKKTKKARATQKPVSKRTRKAKGKK